MSSVKDKSVLIDLIDKCLWSVVLERIKNHPEEVSLKWNKNDLLPLHEACKNQPPKEVVAALIAQNRPALYHQGQFGYVPLHFAIKCEASLDVVSYLIEKYPYGTRTKEDSGKLPLHLACEYGTSPESVNLLLINHPQAIIMTDRSGKRPMSYATTDKSYNHGGEGDIVTVLQRATWYCKVSKAATLRASDEFDAKMTFVERSHCKQMEQQQEKFESERQKHKDSLYELNRDMNKEREQHTKTMEELNREFDAKTEQQKFNLQTLQSKLEKMTSAVDDLTEKLAQQKARTKEDLESARTAYDDLSAENKKEREHNNGLTEALHGCEEVIAERKRREEKMIGENKTMEQTVESVAAENEELWADLKQEREHSNDLAGTLQDCQIALSDREKDHTEKEIQLKGKLTEVEQTMSDREKDYTEKEMQLKGNLAEAEQTIQRKTTKINELEEQITSEESLADIITELECLLVEKEVEREKQFKNIEKEKVILQETIAGMEAENKHIKDKSGEEEKKHSKECAKYRLNIEDLESQLDCTNASASQEKERLEGMLDELKEEYRKEKETLKFLIDEGKEGYTKDTTKLKTTLNVTETMLKEANEKYVEQKTWHDSRMKDFIETLNEAHRIHVQQETENFLQIKELEERQAKIILREVAQMSSIQQLELLLKEAEEEKDTFNAMITNEIPVENAMNLNNKKEEANIVRSEENYRDDTFCFLAALKNFRLTLPNSIILEDSTGEKREAITDCHNDNKIKRNEEKKSEKSSLVGGNSVSKHGNNSITSGVLAHNSTPILQQRSDDKSEVRVQPPKEERYFQKYTSHPSAFSSTTYTGTALFDAMEYSISTIQEKGETIKNSVDPSSEDISPTPLLSGLNTLWDHPLTI